MAPLKLSPMKKWLILILAIVLVGAFAGYRAVTNMRSGYDTGLNIPSTGDLSAKRTGPKDVSPVTFNGVRYEALLWGKTRGLEQNGGYIVAKDVATGKELWLAKIYSITYDTDLETDVQDVFIQSINLSDDKKSLNITDERGRRFIFDLNTRKVLTSQ